MAILASHIAEYLGSSLIGTQGAMDRTLKAARPITQPASGALSYLKSGYPNLEAVAPSLAGMALVCSPEHARLLAGMDVTCLVAEVPRLAFMRAVARFFSHARPPAGVHPRAVVDPSAQVAASASIGANCVIGAHCMIGERTVLHPSVTLLDGVRVGADVTINSGTVVGADGFGYERNESGELEKFPHIGGVIIEDNVEIGSNTSIDRGTLGDTIIRYGARIDNQCHISHNVVIGRHVAVIAQSMVGGSVAVGDHAWLAPAAIIMNQVKIGEKATVGLGAVVVKDVPAGQTVMGAPAVSAQEFRDQRAAIKKLLG